MGFLGKLISGVGNFFTGGLASGIGDFIGGIGSAFGMGQPSLADQVSASKDLAKYEHDLSMEAWREQTAYNDPSRIMERLKTAKINPHAIAGNASITGNASAAPTASIGDIDVSKFQKGMNPDGIMRAMSAFNAYKQQKANVRLTNAQARSLETQSDNNEALNPGIYIDNDNKKVHGDILKQELRAKELTNQIARDPVIGDLASRKLLLKEQSEKVQQLLNDNSLHKYRKSILEYKKTLVDFGVNPENGNPITTLIGTLFAQTMKTYGISCLPDLISNLKSWFKDEDKTENSGDVDYVETAMELVEIGNEIIGNK